MYGTTPHTLTVPSLNLVMSFPTRREGIDYLKSLDNVPEDFKLTEDPQPCDDCGEDKDYNFLRFCKPCRFRNSDSVKASRKIIRSAKRHGNPVVAVWDGEDTIKGNERELLETVHGVDVSKLILESGAQVLIVGGNESESDCVSDYSMSIEDIVTDAKLKDEPER